MKADEDLKKYLIQPFVTGKRIHIEISLAQNEVISMKAFDEDEKRIKLGQRMKKHLKDSYVTSKFYHYPTVLTGVLHINEKNRTVLILDDIMLKRDYDARHCTMRYSQRYENLILRFLSTKSDEVKYVFSIPWSDHAKNVFESQFVKTNKTEKIAYRKDTTDLTEENSFLEDIWTDHADKVVSYEEGIVKQREFNEKQEITSELDVPAIIALIVQDEQGKETKVNLDNIPDKMKVDLKKTAMENASSLIGKTCIYREYSFEDKHGFVYFDLRS